MFEQLSSAELQELLLRFTVEAILVGGFMLLCYFCLGIRQVVKTIGGWKSHCLFAFFVAFTAIQLLDRWQYHFPPRMSFYPLARFAMYQTGSADKPLHGYRFEGQFDNQFRELNITQEFAAIGLPAISSRFRVLGRDLTCHNPQQSSDAQQEIERFLSSIVEKRRAMNEPVPEQVQFVVENHAWHFDPSTGNVVVHSSDIATVAYTPSQNIAQGVAHD